MAKKEMQYTDIKCSKCGEKIISHPQIDYLYGNPIRNCPFCTEEYLDPFVHEIAVDGLRKDPRLVKKLFKDLLISGILTVVLAIINILAILAESVSFILFFLFFGCFFLGLYKITLFFVNKGQMKKQYVKQIEESEARLQNREYAQKLKGYGLNVPQQYL